MSSDTNDSPVISEIDNQDPQQKWHKNYTRLMPYYYVNHKAKFTLNKEGSIEKLVRVRRVTKTRNSLVLEIAEKDNSRKTKNYTERNSNCRMGRFRRNKFNYTQNKRMDITIH